MEEFKKNQLGFFIQLIALSAVTFGLHSYLVHYFFDDVVVLFPLWQIYVFHVLVTTVIYTLINYRYSNGHKAIFNLFMGLTILKMVLSIAFLLPLFLSDLPNKQADVINFFIPYFIYLFFEVYSLTSFLQKS